METMHQKRPSLSKGTAFRASKSGFVLRNCFGRTAQTTLTAFALAAMTFISSVASAQLTDHQALGVFSLLNDPSVRESLKLEPETEAEFSLWFGDRRAAADKLSEEIADLSPAEKLKAVREFAAASVEAGREKLSDEQFLTLSQLGMAYEGMSSLADKELASKVGLSDEQQAELTKLVNQRDLELSAARGIQRELIRNRYEVQMAKLLDNIQFSAWRVLAGDVTTEESLALTKQADQLAENMEVSAPSRPESVPAPKSTTQEKPATSERSAAEMNSLAISSEPQEIDRPITINFEKTEWGPVLEWFAEQGGFSIEMVDTPEGTFTYIDEDGKYSVSEALDQINHVLRAHGFTLVRNRRMLFLIDYESNDIPEAIVETITPAQLKDRGRYEVMRCIFELGTLSADDLEDEIEPIIEDDEDTGKFFAVPTANRLLVQSTGNNLRTINDMIEAARAKTEVTIGEYELQFATPEEVMVVARPLLGIETDEWADEDGNIRIAVTGFGSRFFYQGTPERMSQFKQICERIDTDPGGESTDSDLPYLRSYPVSGDLETAFTVLQTQLAGIPDVRMAKDETKGAIIIKARKAQHEEVEATLKLLDGSDVVVRVIPLRRLDAVDVVAQIRELWGDATDASGNTKAGPTVSTDIASNAIIVRDVPYRVEQIQAFVEQLDPSMGEAGGSDPQKIRHLEMTESEARDAIQWIETMWEVQGTGNRLQIVMPEDRKGSINEKTVVPLQNNRTIEGNNQGSSSGAPQTAPRNEPRTRPQSNDSIDRFLPRQNAPNSNDNKAGTDPRANEVASRNNALQTRFVSLQEPSGNAQDEMRINPSGQIGSDIIVRVTPYGLIIESEDLAALDAFEDMIFSKPYSEGETVKRVYYLKHRGAEEASGLLKQVLGISGSGGGGGILNSFAQNALGPGLGGLASGFLGGGGGDGGDVAANITTLGMIDIIPDARLNAIVVIAVEEDHEQVDELLSYIDQPQAPQSPETTGRFHVIPVQYANANDLLGVITSQMSDYIKSQNSSGGGGDAAARAQQQFLQQILGGGRGGRRGGGGGGGGGGVEIESPKMSVSADPTSNSILVTGPDFLYEQVKEIVETLDQPSIVESQGMAIIKLEDGVSPEVYRAALQNLVGSGGVRQTSQNTPGSNRSTTTPRSTSQFQFPSAGFPGFQGGGAPSGFGGGRTTGGFGGRTGGFGGRGSTGRGGGGTTGRGGRGGR